MKSPRHSEGLILLFRKEIQRRQEYLLQYLLLRWLCLGILPAEALDAAGGIEQLLLAGEERVAIGTNFHIDVAVVSRTGHKRISACAVNANFTIVGMSCCLHISFNALSNH